MFEKLENLEIYGVSETLADMVWIELAKWDSFAKNTVGYQLTKAIDSVGANIAESFGRFHYKDKINFLYYARGSLYETKWWLARVEKRKLMDFDKILIFKDDVDKLLLKLNAYIKSKKNR